MKKYMIILWIIKINKYIINFMKKKKYDFFNENFIFFNDFLNEKNMIFLCFFYDFFEGGAGRKNH